MTRLRCYALGLFIALALAGVGIHRQVSAQAPGEKGPEADPPPKTKMAGALSGVRSKNAEIVRMLQQTVSTDWLKEKNKLDRVLIVLSEKSGGKVSFFIDSQSIVAAQGGGPDVPDPKQEEVGLSPDDPSKLPLGIVLHALISQVGNGKATFIVRREMILVVAKEKATAAALLQYPVALTLKDQPLHQALDELSDSSGMTIFLDAQIGADLRKTSITAAFRNVPLEDALVAVTEAAGLKVVVLRSSVYVTTPEHSKQLDKEQHEREKQRPNR